MDKKVHTHKPGDRSSDRFPLENAGTVDYSSARIDFFDTCQKMRKTKLLDQELFSAPSEFHIPILR